MSIKSIKTTTKIDLKNSKLIEQKDSKKKDSNKKIVVKRRKTELIPTKASAVAIASQANRVKKNALIKRLASSNMSGGISSSSDTKIPVWVRVFFGCSLLLFCVSFYKAIIYPQLNVTVVGTDVEEFVVAENGQVIENDADYGSTGEIEQEYIQEEQSVYDISETEKVLNTATDTIEEFFIRLSDRNFNGAFELITPSLRSYPDIKNHFTSFRMNPFLDGIEGGRLSPTNFKYIESPSYGRDVYDFDLSYIMSSDQSKYDETWEFTVNTQGDNPLITSMRCKTSKCSYHPIFWPENFGLMK